MPASGKAVASVMVRIVRQRAERPRLRAATIIAAMKTGSWWVALALLCSACSPTLDWREVRPEGSGAVALFPCKPSREVRRLALAGAPVEMTVVACRAGGAMYALAYADVRDPGQVGAALIALRDAAAANIGASAVDVQPLQVAGMTPHPHAHSASLDGRLPDGGAVQERLAVFPKGTRVFQATTFGARLDAEATDTYFGGLRLSP